MSLQHEGKILVLLCVVCGFRDQLSSCVLPTADAISMLSLLVRLVYDHCHLDV